MAAVIEPASKLPSAELIELRDLRSPDLKDLLDEEIQKITKDKQLEITMNPPAPFGTKPGAPKPAPKPPVPAAK